MRRLIPTMLVLLAVLWACVPAVRGPGRDIGATLIPMTPVPRTPRPTLTTVPSVTPTGTIPPTPTALAGGIHVFEDSAVAGIEGGCDQWVGVAAEAGLSVSRTDQLAGGKNYEICNMGASAVTVSIASVGVTAQGYPTNAGYIVRCAEPDKCNPSFAGWSATPYVVPTGPGLCEVTHAEATDSATLYPYYEQSGDPQNIYEIYLYTESLAFDCAAVYLEGFVITQPNDYWQPTPGPTPTLVGTPTPDGEGNCWVTEVFSKQAGAGTDYNLRRGAGTDDEFVEVGCNPTQSLAGWEIDVGSTITYTIKADNLTGPLKVYWLDGFTNYSSTVTMPVSDTVTLRNASATPVATRTYRTADGLSWAASAWTNPAGIWWYYAPSPGWGGAYMPTLTPAP